jgi:hypothetical protein
MRTSLLLIAMAAGVAAAGCGMEGGTLGDPSGVPSPTPLTEEMGFPCDVRAVLEANCAPCHSGNMYVTPLTTRDIWMAKRFDGMTYGQYAARQVADGKMPPPTAQTQPSSDDRALLTAWVAAGMPPGACEPLAPPPR